VKLGLDSALRPTLVTDSSHGAIVGFLAQMESEWEAFYPDLFKGLPPVEGVRRWTEAIVGVDGNELRLFVHEPAERRGLLPGVVHTHGGGMALGSSRDPQYMRWRDELAATGMVIVGVEFRNSAGKLGDHPFPAGLNDCASAARWTYANKDTIGVSRIVVSGESGGGNLCLATALKANQEGWIGEIAGVYSLCPYIAGGYDPPPREIGSLRENEGYDLSPQGLQLFSRAYDPNGDNSENPLTWPYHATKEHLAGLPPHTISVNELDPLRDEGRIFARKLLAAGVPTVSRTVNGTSHGADTVFAAAIPDVYAATLRDIHGFAASL
jgi:acetyl esterase/lipase